MSDSLDVVRNAVGDTVIKILDHGEVELIDVTPYVPDNSGTISFRAAQAARVSHGKDRVVKTSEENNKLIKYLATNGHTSPLEHISFTFRMKLPKFVAIHFIRHRTAKVNEISQRYAEMPDEFYRPTLCGGVRKQSKSNRQASVQFGENEDRSEIEKLYSELESDLSAVLEKYHKLVGLGAAKETARFCLPMAMYTEMYYTIDLNNLIKLLRLRRASDAQWETQEAARAMEKLVRPLVPSIFDMLDAESTQVTFSALEQAAIAAPVVVNGDIFVTSPYPTGATHDSFVKKCQKIGMIVRPQES